MAVFLISTRFDNNPSFVSGSDDDSHEDEGEDETNGMVPVISSVFRSMMETPLDYDDGAGDPAPTADIAEPVEVHPATNEQPSDFYSFTWSDFPTTPIPPEWRRETFSEINVGQTTPMCRSI